MTGYRPTRTIGSQAAPPAVAAAWPADQPLVMLHSGRIDPRWARWSILARPATTIRFDGRAWTWHPDRPGSFADLYLDERAAESLDALARATRIPGPAVESSDLPFAGGWIGSFAYDLGRCFEPVAQHREQPEDDRGRPLIELSWCPDALVFDHLESQWFAVGEPDESLLHDAAPGDGDSFCAGPLVANIDPDRYLDMVARAIDYIAAGDIFQANITQRFTAPFEGSTRRFAIEAMQAAGAWYGAYIESPDDACVLSLSPELFLLVDPLTRQIVTRPIKGTRPASADPRELSDSDKDRAELHMIVDLMRNDLGRVCEPGSVSVPNARTIESHPTVHHGVGEITGVLREHVGPGDLLQATFPPGSVTGAPKIRAMQIIDELETACRGPYCGAIGLISDCGRLCLNVAIRTLLLHGQREPGRFDRLAGTLDYGAGGGIVADSSPADEYRECVDKTAVLRLAMRRQSAPAPAHTSV